MLHQKDYAQVLKTWNALNALIRTRLFKETISRRSLCIILKICNVYSTPILEYIHRLHIFLELHVERLWQRPCKAPCQSSCGTIKIPWDCTCKSSTVYRTNYGIGKTKPLFQRFRVGCKTTEKTNNDGVLTGGWWTTCTCALSGFNRL